MNGSNGRSPWLCVRSWTRSQSTKVSSASRCDSSSLAASGGSSSLSVSVAALDTRLNRAASRSAKMPPQVKRSGAWRTATVSGKSTAEWVS